MEVEGEPEKKMSESDKYSLDVFKKASESGDVPKIYFNHPVVFYNPGDISMLLQMNGSPVAVINMSFTVAKTVAAHLGSVIAGVEEKTGNKIMTIDDIATALGMK
ncbi:MAG: hypothetical protein HQL01_12610 [Nitrospirae bacterium]|nr:hypothetical protein [Nitrospirota bacterium]